MKRINFADLMGRDVIPLQTSEAQAALQRQIILVTGAAGSIGSELSAQLLNYGPERVIALDTNETGLFDLAEGLRPHPHAARLCPCIGDITDGRGMARLFSKERPGIIFHAAAYKHVPLLEQFPDQALRTNVLATYHLCRLAQEHHVTNFVFVSTDKAAEPIGVMGASKRVGEMIVQAFAKSASCVTCFSAVRFGNVIGSRGSVVPVFAQQIEQGGPLRVTDPEATRYFMTIHEACELVILIVTLAERGGLYLLDMGSPVRIIDLATKMLHLCGLRPGEDISILYTGLRPGERLHEPLLAPDEVLTPSACGKIFCVTCRTPPPKLTTIAQWMDTLKERFLWGSKAELRSRLFQMVREQELRVSPLEELETLNLVAERN
jgi:FlaA1/EpsC-like NDP-sugar epimerase